LNDRCPARGTRWPLTEARIFAKRLLIIGALSLGFARVSEAQQQQTAEPGSEFTIYLMTMGAGDEVWEKFGHNAIWVHNALTHIDVAYNWGLFDFNSSDFLPRFLKGDMLYWMGGFDLQSTIDQYRQANRPVWAQELNLTPSQRYSLVQFIEWNERPENRFYHYDYYRDNCSTRVRDALDRALGGVIRRASENAPSGTTYRSHTRRLTQGDTWVYVGTLLGLGQPVDHPITRWEEMFLPVRLRNDIRGIRVRDATGASVPLVKSEMTLFASTRPPEAEAPSTHIPAYFIAGMLVLFVALMLRHLADEGSNGARIGLLLFAGAWNLVVGFFGTLLAALWLFTNHLYSYYNENLLQANELSLIVAVMIFASLRKKTRPSGGVVSAATELIAWIVAALAILGFVIQILPAFYQVNGEIIAMILPAHVGVALALWRRSVWPVRGGARVNSAPAT
jgi:hypothetical protein